MVTRYHDGLGHPFVFAAEAIPVLRGLHGDKAVWKLVEGAGRDRIAESAVARNRPIDVDAPEDYRAVLDAFSPGAA